MKATELFKMLEASNAMNELIGEKCNHISFTYERYFICRFRTFKEFKKYIKREFISPEDILNLDFTQDERYKYSFNATIDTNNYEIEILQD